MISIKEYESCIAISGHAGQAPKGSDLCCCAVSTLVQNLIQSMVELTNDKISFDVKEGEALITYKKNISSAGRLLIRSFFIGIREIADLYPDSLQVSRLGRQ